MPATRADLGVRAVRGDHQARQHRLARSGSAHHREAHGVCADHEVLRTGGDPQRQVRARCEPVPQRHADRAVRDHVTEGIDPVLGGVEAREPESPRLRDVNGADGCGRGRNRLQHPRPSKMRRLALPSAVVRSSKLACPAAPSGELSTSNDRTPVPARPAARLAPTMPPPTMATSTSRGFTRLRPAP